MLVKRSLMAYFNGLVLSHLDCAYRRCLGIDSVDRGKMEKILVAYGIPS